MTELYCSRGHHNPIDSRFCRHCGETLSPFSTAGMVGRMLDTRYQIIQELGQGGFGRTYLAEDTHRFHERCVLKEFAPQVEGTQALRKAEELFEREAGVLYKLQHPQIPRFRELFRADVNGTGCLFLVQDYVAGETYQALLRQRQAQGNCFDEAEVMQLLQQILPVLAYIHSVGVVHRDISPDNLIHRSSDGLPVLIDFGGVKQIAATVALQMNPSLPVAIGSSTTRLGKIGYAPDEQMASGEVSPHSDLYALAVTVLVLLTGNEPQDLLATDRRHWHRSVKLNKRLLAVLDRMLNPFPAKRYQTAQDVLQALGKAGKTVNLHPPTATVPVNGIHPTHRAITPIQVAPTPTAPAATAPKRRSSGGAILVLLVLGAAVGGWWEGRKWLAPLLESPSKPSQPIAQKPPAKAEPPAYSAKEQQRKQAINKRREELGISSTFLVNLVDSSFYSKHPNLKGQQLSAKSTDEGLRSEWDALAMQWLDQLEGLTASERSRLGNFSKADIDKRRLEVNKLNLSSRSLNDLTDARFFSLFPDQARNDEILQQPIGQVWQSIAADQLKLLQAGKTLQELQPPARGNTVPLNGTLKPGEGMAYIVKLTKNQSVKLEVKSDRRDTLVSFYPPSSKKAALLEDSDQGQWSGKLADSGYYEIVVVSHSANPIDYSLEFTDRENVTIPFFGQ